MQNSEMYQQFENDYYHNKTKFEGYSLGKLKSFVENRVVEF